MPWFSFTSRSFPVTLPAALFYPPPHPRVSSGLRGKTLRCLRGHGLLTGLALSKGRRRRSWSRHEAWGRRGCPPAAATKRGQAVTAPLPPSPVTALQLGPRSLVAAVPPCPRVSAMPTGLRGHLREGAGADAFPSYPLKLPSRAFCK